MNTDEENDVWKSIKLLIKTTMATLRPPAFNFQKFRTEILDTRSKTGLLSGPRLR